MNYLDPRTREAMDTYLYHGNGSFDNLDFRQLPPKDRKREREAFDNAHNQLHGIIRAYESRQEGKVLDKKEITDLSPLLERFGYDLNDLQENIDRKIEDLQEEINAIKVFDDEIDRVLQTQFRSTCEKVIGTWLYKKCSPVAGLVGKGIKPAVFAAAVAAATALYLGRLHLPFELPYFG